MAKSPRNFAIFYDSVSPELRSQPGAALSARSRALSPQPSSQPGALESEFFFACFSTRKRVTLLGHHRKLH